MQDQTDICQCCGDDPVEDQCFDCGKPLCLPCSYAFEGHSFCRQTFKTCFHSWLSTTSLDDIHHPDASLQIDPNEYRAVIPCSHAMENRQKQDKAKVRNHARKERRKARDQAKIDGSRQRDLSFFIPADQVSRDELGWPIWLRQREFNEFMQKFRPDFLEECVPFNSFMHPKKSQLSHSYHLRFKVDPDAEQVDYTVDFKKLIGQIYNQELKPALIAQFGLDIRS